MNKGGQNPALEDAATTTPISIFYAEGDPLRAGSWKQQTLGEYRVPHNAQPIDLDGDGDIDFVATRGNSAPFDGVFWLEQVRSTDPMAAFARARQQDSQEMPLAD